MCVCVCVCVYVCKLGLSKHQVNSAWRLSVSHQCNHQNRCIVRN